MADKFGKAQAPIDFEGEALVTGKGQYTDDLAPEDALFGVFVRSSIAHGIIQNIDIEDAKQSPGVIDIIMAADLAKIGCKPLMVMAPFSTLDGKTKVPFVVTPRPILVDERVRHVGELIALVVATSLGAAQDAADLVDVDIEALTAHTACALSDDPVDDPIWEEAPNNQSYTWFAGDQEGVQEALANASHKVSVSLRNQRVAGSPMEPRAAVASYNVETSGYTLYIGTQGTMAPRKGIADALDVDVSKLRLISKDVGGAFGLKVQAYPEYVAISAASRLLGRPVRWTSTRSEALMSDLGGRDSTVDITGAFDDEGHLQAIYCDIVGNIGAYAFGAGIRVPSSVVAENITGVYSTPKIAIKSCGVHTNTIPTSPYRGAGRPEAIYMLERLMDKAARQLGIDQMELRRLNLIPKNQLPYTSPMNMVYDSGDFAAVLDTAMERVDWTGFDKRREEARERGMLRGIGCSLFAETAGAFLTEPFDFRVTENGVIEVRVGGLAAGQRHASTIVHLMSERFGIDRENFRFIAGDSDDVPAGPASVGSRVAQMTGSAAAQAVENAIVRGRTIVSQIDGGGHNDIDYADGYYTIVGTGERIGFLEIPKRVSALKAQGVEIEETLDGINTFTAPRVSFPNGCHICEVEIDPQTGYLEIENYVAVDDCGNLLNPPVVEGQLVGGIAQGIGQALLEEVVYDDDGQLLSGSFMDYAMPRASDMPKAMTIVDLPDPTPSNPLGTKGVGESGTTGSLATVVNAVEDALRPLGVEHVQMPLTPGRIWEAIRAAGG